MKTFFWMAVVVSFVGSMSCLGYAGLQTVPSVSTETSTFDAANQLAVRSPVSFVRDAL